MQIFHFFNFSIFFFFISIANAYWRPKNPWTTELSELLALHNAYRQAVKYGKVADQPPAVNMAHLQWCFKLASLSRNWAMRCQSERSNMTMRQGASWKYVGQSVAVVSNVRNAVIQWFSEHNNYNFITNQCKEKKTCANYKQLVFSETTHVGCAYNKCGNFAAPNNTVVVCSYGPGVHVCTRSYAEFASQSASQWLNRFPL
ncbi:unnamed protein product [Heterobilharzia americana]|nr:unnamed protein product [Heterobilharzia americana]